MEWGEVEYSSVEMRWNEMRKQETTHKKKLKMTPAKKKLKMTHNHDAEKEEAPAKKKLKMTHHHDVEKEEAPAKKELKMSHNHIYSREYHKFLRCRGFKKPIDAPVETRKEAAAAGRWAVVVFKSIDID